MTQRVYVAQVKDHVVRPGFHCRAMEPEWPKRGMQFTDLPSGDLNMQRYVERLILAGYLLRSCEIMGAKTALLGVEAESAHKDRGPGASAGIPAGCLPGPRESRPRAFGEPPGGLVLCAGRSGTRVFGDSRFEIRDSRFEIRDSGL